jgi:Flp pilus assembly protein TadD
MGDAALRLNPYDPDMAGFLGLFKITCGQAEAGEALLRRSLALDDSSPGVPAVTLAFILSQRGEQAEARAVLDQMPSPSTMEPQFLMVRAIVLARQGDLAGGQAEWRRLLAYTRQPANAPPETVLGRFMITPAVIQRASAALRESGVVPAKPAP